MLSMLLNLVECRRSNGSYINFYSDRDLYYLLWHFRAKRRLTNVCVVVQMAPLKWCSLIFVLCSCLQPSQAKCGGRTILTDLQGTIHDGPGKYPQNTLCEWLIRGTWAQMLAFRNLFAGFKEATVVGNYKEAWSRKISFTLLLFLTCNLPFIFRCRKISFAFN